jgi:hypothetical protein
MQEVETVLSLKISDKRSKTCGRSPFRMVYSEYL